MPAPDQLVDAFVAFINSQPRDLRLKDEVPESVRVASDADGFASWRIVPGESPWLSELERSLPARLPPTFRSLISRYGFPSFRVGPIVLHGNTAEGTEHHEFRKRLVSDPIMSPLLLREGFIPFANPNGGDYDPVCFKNSGAEPAIVRLDHEEILIRNRIRIAASLARSFGELLEQAMKRAR